MRIEVDERFWYAARRIWKRFWTVQEVGSRENLKWRYKSRFGFRWMVEDRHDGA